MPMLTRVGRGTLLPGDSLPSCLRWNPALFIGSRIALADKNLSAALMGLAWNCVVWAGLDLTGRVCTQVDIRCTDAEEIVSKARDLVAAYTEVSQVCLGGFHCMPTLVCDPCTTK